MHINFYLRFFIACTCLSTGVERLHGDDSPKQTLDMERPRVIVTSDGEVDDECSMVRFLLYANEWDTEAIITSSSQYHWQGHKWAGDDWIQPYLKAYAAIHPNLILHDPRYPTADYLQSVNFLGNVKAEGEMDEVTPGSQRIVEVLLDDSDPRPIWIQAWGGTNTIARALKTIQEKHPERMAAVASKIRLYLIWEQDSTYQDYIRRNWGKYEIPTIISDQFIAVFYHWKKYLPQEQQRFLEGQWMSANVLKDHGALCSLYKAHENGDFRSEGDSPAFMHTIPTGLRNLDSPGWGGWGGQFQEVRKSVWLDPVQEPNYTYPSGRWYGNSAWGRERLRRAIPNDQELTAYLKPMWRWIEPMQNDFAARADWCVKSFSEANHPPQVQVAGPLDLKASPGEKIHLNAADSKDSDGDKLSFHWWQFEEADSYAGRIAIASATSDATVTTVPADIEPGQTIHVVCEVTDDGTPALTRYQRFVITADGDAKQESTNSVTTASPQEVTVWTLEDPSSIAGTQTTVLGAPEVIDTKIGKAIAFDGKKDGIIVPINPVDGLKEFTIEALIQPASNGNAEQRFLHFEDAEGNRGLLELRQIPDGGWALDTFLLAGESKRTLLDRSQLHPANRWTWVALTYRDGKMSHYIDGVQEQSGPVMFASSGLGRTSLGVRMNQVSWFKGAIREVRFHATALSEDQLQKSVEIVP